MKYLFVKFLRDLKKMWAQFVSVFLMALISLMIFSGMSSVWNGLKISSKDYFESTNLADVWVYAGNISDTDMEAVKNLSYVQSAESQMTLTVGASLEDGSNTDIRVTSLDMNDLEVLNPLIRDGNGIDNTEGIWIDEDYASEHDLKTGDNIAISIENNEFTVPVKGIVLDSENIFFITSAIDSVPDHIRHGYAYISADYMQQITGANIDNQIRIKLSDESISKEQVRTDMEQILGNRLYSVSERQDVMSVWRVMDEQSQIFKMAIMFSAIFILLSLLTMYTTMSRLVNNQIVQIGTMKALGYSKIAIYIHYALYGTIISLAGGLCGIIGGLLVVSNMVMNVKKATLTLPEWIKDPGVESVLVFALIVIICTISALITVRKVVKGVPAQTIRGIVEQKHINTKKKKRSHMSYEWLWTLRSIKAHPVKYAMGVVAVVGSIVLLVAGTGIWDSLNYSYDDVFNREYKYQYAATIKSGMFDSLEKGLEGEDVQYAQSSSALFTSKNSQYAGTVTVLTEGDLVNLYSSNTGDKIDMSDDGVYVTKKMAEEMKLETGDTIEFQIDNTDIKRSETITAVVDAKLPQGIFITDTLFGADYSPNTAYFANSTGMEKAEQSGALSGIISAKEQRANIDTMLKSIHTIVYILFVAAFILASVIIYNLGTLNYIERYREYATMKVLGFYKKEINAMVLRDCIMSLVTGLIIGIPLSIVFLKLYVGIVSMDNMEWTAHISIFNYIMVLIIVISFTIMVNLLVCRKVKKVDMVEALKSID